MADGDCMYKKTHCLSLVCVVDHKSKTQQTVGVLDGVQSKRALGEEKRTNYYSRAKIYKRKTRCLRNLGPRSNVQQTAGAAGVRWRRFNEQEGRRKELSLFWIIVLNEKKVH